MEVSGQLHTSDALPSAKNPATHQTWGRVGPRADLDDLEGRKVCCPYKDSNPLSSSWQSSHYTDYTIPAPQGETSRWNKNSLHF